MIWLSAYYGHGTIDLLSEEKAHHFMAECHAGERQKSVGTVVDGLRESVWTAYYEEYSLISSHHHFLYHRGEFT